MNLKVKGTSPHGRYIQLMELLGINSPEFPIGLSFRKKHCMDGIFHIIK